MNNATEIFEQWKNDQKHKYGDPPVRTYPKDVSEIVKKDEENAS